MARHLARPRTATARASRRRRRVTAGAAISPQYAWSWKTPRPPTRHAGLRYASSTSQSVTRPRSIAPRNTRAAAHSLCTRPCTAARPNVGQLSRGPRGEPPPARPKHHRRVASAPYPLIKTTPQRRRSLSEADLEVALPLAEPEKVRRRPDRGALPVVAALTLLCVAAKINHKVAAVQQHRTARRLVEVEAHAAPTTDPRAVEARAARCADVKCASPSLDVVFASCDDEAGLWSNTGVTLESCSSDDANQDIQVMFNKQYTHNIKFTGFGDYCLTGHSGSDAKDRVVYGESCDQVR